MNRLHAATTALALLTAFHAPAQQSQSAPRGPLLAPAGGSSQERLRSVIILPKPGASFSATVVTEWTRNLADGTTTTVKNRRFVARDSSGRTFQERRFLIPNGDTILPPLSALEYHDPTRHEYTTCDPRKLICLVSTDHYPTSIPQPTATSGTLPNGSGTFTRESLGQKTIEALDAIGTRQIVTRNAGVAGYEHAEPSVKELWYSERLEVELVTKSFDPRAGASTITLQNISLAEPDQKLFLPPEGYKIINIENDNPPAPRPTASR
jgi:hypothetical protein